MVSTRGDFNITQDRIDARILAFNKRYSLDVWDYGIVGSCGLFAAMLDILCVKAPPKPTTSWAKKVEGIFNSWVQEAFNSFIPSGLSEQLSKRYTIGAPDSSTITQLINAPKKLLNPINHRLRALSHDPVLGIIFGVLDMMHGTCTTVVKGKIVRIPSHTGPTEGNIFQLIGKMLGHLVSDVNAPSAKGNRGMGLPAPFMGFLRMFENIPVGDSDFGKQIEWMYVNGYDFRQFTVTSIPMVIMEALLRAFYVAKQISINDVPFKEAMLDTVPLKMNPRFRIMLALAYGTTTSINTGKVYVTQDILNANYASWMGLIWNSIHALKWALYSRHMALWGAIEEAEIKELESLLEDIGTLEERAARLPF